VLGLAIVAIHCGIKGVPRRKREKKDKRGKDNGGKKRETRIYTPRHM
jgi:hypothetical protein